MIIERWHQLQTEVLHRGNEIFGKQRGNTQAVMILRELVVIKP